MEKSTFKTKVGLAEMLKGGVIMDVVTAEQAVIAQLGPLRGFAVQRCPGAGGRPHAGVILP